MRNRMIMKNFAAKICHYNFNAEAKQFLSDNLPAQ